MAGWFKKMANALVGNEVEDDDYEYYADYEDEQQPQQRERTRENREQRQQQPQLRDASRDNRNMNGNDRNIREVHINNQRNQHDEYNRNDGKVVRMSPVPQSEIALKHPETVDDALEVCKLLKENKSCIINLEQVQDLHAQRIVDFLSGAAYALNGAVQKISGDIFLVCPRHVYISGQLKEEIKQGNFSFPKVNFR